MGKKEWVVCLVLCLALAVSILVPVQGLFIDGVYNWHIKQAEMSQMLLEITVLAVILVVIFLGIKGNGKRMVLTGITCTIFIWGHVVFMPMLVSGLYMGYLYLVGNIIRTRLLKATVGAAGFLDLLLGCMGTILLFALLSALGIGSIPVLKTAVVILGLTALIWHGGSLWKSWMKCVSRLEARKLGVGQLLLLAFMIVMVLIQIGRMNISIDFDSLWYGVRSEYILNNGGGIYENLGSVGLVYTYSKGLEILVLPLSDLPSYSYLTGFNVWAAVLTLAAVYRIGRFYMSSAYALLAAACVSSIPAVMNMSITAKTDSMTLLVQLVMVLFMLYFLKKKQMGDLFVSLAACLFSWTLKPTAVVFSTAVFGMSVIYLMVWRLKQPATGSQLGGRKSFFRVPWRLWLIPGIAFAGLAAVWLRTMMIVGIPVTSVFSSIFLKLGFQIKYPFAHLPLYAGGSGDSLLPYLAETVYRMLLLPVGENMSHVVFSWGSSLIFFFIVICLLGGMVKKGKTREDKSLAVYGYTVMIPFIMVNLVSLVMLGQIDGNYFILLYVFLVLCGCRGISMMDHGLLRKRVVIMLMPLLLLNTVISAVSNWAWSLGFTPIQVINPGYFDHEAAQKKVMEESGNIQIWRILEENPQTRVIAIGEHPQVFGFPCNVQSYDDITSDWGNVELVKTMDYFIRYLEYAKTDYIYMQTGGVEKDSRCYELMGYLIEAGILTDVVYEAGNMLAKVDLLGEYSQEAQQEYKRYFKNYIVKE